MGGHADQEDAGHEGEPHPGLSLQVGLRKERVEEVSEAGLRLPLSPPCNSMPIYWKPVMPNSTTANKRGCGREYEGTLPPN